MLCTNDSTGHGVHKASGDRYATLFKPAADGGPGLLAAHPVLARYLAGIFRARPGAVRARAGRLRARGMIVPSSQSGLYGAFAKSTHHTEALDRCPKRFRGVFLPGQWGSDGELRVLGSWHDGLADAPSRVPLRRGGMAARAPPRSSLS